MSSFPTLSPINTAEETQPTLSHGLPFPITKKEENPPLLSGGLELWGMDLIQNRKPTPN